MTSQPPPNNASMWTSSSGNSTNGQVQGNIFAGHAPIAVMTAGEFDTQHANLQPLGGTRPLNDSVPGEYTSRFHLACNVRGLKPEFTFEEPTQGSFHVSVHIGPQREFVGSAGPYGSKKLAKEELCRQAIDKIQSVNMPGFTLESSTGEWTTKFQHACDARRLLPRFTYHEVAQQRFDAQVFFGDDFFDGVGPYPSKKLAKELLSKQALHKLQPLQPKPPQAHRIDLPQAPSNLMTENWISILHDYAQSQRIDFPVFHETAPHVSLGPFSCTVTFSGSRLLPFGTAAGPFRTKSEAKKNAAMEAVLWLRAEGKLGSGAAAHEGTPPRPAELPANVAGSSSPESSPSATAAADDRSLPMRVVTVAQALGITPPRYNITGQEGQFVTMEAVFLPHDVGRNPELAGPVGQVQTVYGKKAAKMRCSRAVLEVLERIEKGRKAEAADWIKRNFRKQGVDTGKVVTESDRIPGLGLAPK